MIEQVGEKVLNVSLKTFRVQVRAKLSSRYYLDECSTRVEGLNKLSEATMQ